MSAKYSGIPGSRPDTIVEREVRCCNRGWEGRPTGWIFGLVVLAGLLLAGASSAGASLAHQPAGGSTTPQQQQAVTCSMHQSQQSATCPMHERSEQADQKQRGQDHDHVQGAEPQHSHQNHEAMNQRGNAGMGFDQEKTTHHFRLSSDGGAIEVQANDDADSASRDQIRAHLSHIAQMFSAGDFSIPMFVHDQPPPGADTMKQLKGTISYKYQETERGGRVKIITRDPQALEAIHAFLRFQIREHKTGDPLEIAKP